MLHIYTRHAADCVHAHDTQWRRCRCPKWLRGVLPNGEPIRESAGTRSWEQAERNARKKEALRAVLQSSAGTACSFRKAGLEEANSTASE